MSKNSKRGQRRGSGPLRRWTFGHLAVAFALGLGLGGALGYATGESAGGTPAGADGQQIEPLSSTDRFDRSPGHPHYRHDHP
jgi:hypothetical protein